MQGVKVNPETPVNGEPIQDASGADASGAPVSPTPLPTSRADGPPSDPRWWIPWVALAVLCTVSVAIPAVRPEVEKVRRQMRAQRCREQMLALAEGQVQHYLDHQSFTTEQRALTRYIPYAEHARCASCSAVYHMDVLKDRVRIRCPCESVRHGWVERRAPAVESSTGSATGSDRGTSPRP